ncbi:MAG: phytanoyl-CoA dioxygenase family protein [Pseudomonadota bacterium]
MRLYHLSVWPKNARDPAYVGWHQDATYFGLQPEVQVTAWIALTAASVEAGCMEVIPGSHKLGQLHHGRSDTQNNLLSRGQTITGRVRSRHHRLHAGAGRPVFAASHPTGA